MSIILDLPTIYVSNLEANLEGKMYCTYMH